MPRRYPFQPGYFYHIYNRTKPPQKLYLEDDNYIYFLKIIKRLLLQFEFSIIAYCLMPTHFHFLIQIKGETDFSAFMSRLLSAYSKAFNKKYIRSGPLFTERFKHVAVSQPEHLLHLCRYIHLNPLKAGLVKDINEWPFSNYLEFIGKRNGELFDSTFRDELFGTGEEYEGFVNDFENGAPKGFGAIVIDA